MKSWLLNSRTRVIMALRNLMTLGAVLPGDEEHDWADIPVAKIIPVDFRRTRAEPRSVVG